MNISPMFPLWHEGCALVSPCAGGNFSRPVRGCVGWLHCVQSSALKPTHRIYVTENRFVLRQRRFVWSFPFGGVCPRHLLCARVDSINVRHTLTLPYVFLASAITQPGTWVPSLTTLPAERWTFHLLKCWASEFAVDKFVTVIRIDTYQQGSADCCGAFVVEGFNSTHRHQVSALFEVLEREPFITILIKFF